MADVNQLVEGNSSFRPPNGNENKRMAWVFSNNANENYAFGYNAYKDHPNENYAFGYNQLKRICRVHSRL